MKPFNLEKAMAGEPVCTRNGSKVKIYDFDFNGRVAAAFLDLDDECWYFITYDQSGYIDKEHTEDGRDLMMADKESYMNVYKFADKEELFGGKIYPTLDDTYKEKEEGCFTDKMWDDQFFCKAKVILIDK